MTLDGDAALAVAATADRAVAAASPGPLHGLPIAVKDLEDTAGMRTTYGSPLFPDHVPTPDSLLVARRGAPGAIVIGKTNTPEFGAGSQTFNPVFGATRNPYDPVAHARRLAAAAPPRRSRRDAAARRRLRPRRRASATRRRSATSSACARRPGRVPSVPPTSPCNPLARARADGAHRGRRGAAAARALAGPTARAAVARRPARAFADLASADLGAAADRLEQTTSAACPSSRRS